MRPRLTSPDALMSAPVFALIPERPKLALLSVVIPAPALIPVPTPVSIDAPPPTVTAGAYTDILCEGSGGTERERGCEQDCVQIGHQVSPCCEVSGTRRHPLVPCDPTFKEWRNCEVVRVNRCLSFLRLPYLAARSRCIEYVEHRLGSSRKRVFSDWCRMSHKSHDSPSAGRPRPTRRAPRFGRSQGKVARTFAASSSSSRLRLPRGRA